jgi:hypothetical protein
MQHSQKVTNQYAYSFFELSFKVKISMQKRRNILFNSLFCISVEATCFLVSAVPSFVVGFVFLRHRIMWKSPNNDSMCLFIYLHMQKLTTFENHLLLMSEDI